MQTKKWGLRKLKNEEICSQESSQGTSFGPRNSGSLRFLNNRTAPGRVTDCLKDHHVDTDKKARERGGAGKVSLCDRESHE